MTGILLPPHDASSARVQGRSCRWKIFLPVITAAAVLQSSAFATNWKTPGSGDWHDLENWSLGIPDSSATANINQGTATIASGNAVYKALQLGASTPAHIEISGGSLSGESTNLGYQSQGYATVTGGSWGAGSLTLGMNGEGYLSLANGSVSSTSTVLGNFAGAYGEITIHSGSLTQSGLMKIGAAGEGLMTIAGGTVSNTSGRIGNDAGGVGAVSMTGGEWNNSGVLYIGWSGHGTLDCQDGILRSTGAVLAQGSNSSGTATVSGGTWTNTGKFTVGDGNIGSLTISGGSITNQGGDFLIGSSQDGEGTVTINSGSIAAEYLDVGIQGIGELNINGGEVENRATALGLQAGSGTATITAGKWTLSEELVVGYFGTGKVNIQGGTVTSGVAWLGYQNSQLGKSKGDVTVTSGLWQVNGKLYVGVLGDGALEISGGVVRVAEDIVAGHHTDSTSRIRLLGDEDKRGVLEAVKISTRNNGADATLSFDGGILRAGADESNFISDYSSDALTIESGGAYIDTNGYSVGIASVFSGEGVLVKQGEGTLTLSAANQHTGGTRIEGGTIIAANANAFGIGEVSVTEGTLAIGKTISLANTIRLNGGLLAREVGSGQSLANAFAVSSTLGDREIAATILDGTSSKETTLHASFHEDSSALNDSVRIAPILSLSNVAVVDPLTGETDLFVLQLSIDNLSLDDYLAWFDPSTNQWVNAVEGNFGGTARFVGNRGYDEAIDFTLGTYGVDLDNGAVWAVLNHNSAFSIVAIPEPATWAFMALGAALLCTRVRQQHKSDHLRSN